MSENSNAGKIIISVLIGGAIGSALALLFAPKSGREIRSDISQKTKEIIEDGKNTSEQLWTGTKEKVGNIMDGANEVLNKARTLIVDEAKKVKSAAQAGFSKYSSESSSEEQNQPVMEQGEVNKN
jgi:gas vesicle protein